MEIQLRLESAQPRWRSGRSTEQRCTDRLAVSVPRPTVAAVFVADDRVIYSASDLAAAARCEYALLRAFDAKLGRGPAVSVEDALLARTATLGDEHEQRHLDVLRDQADGDVAVIGSHVPLHRRGSDGGGQATTGGRDTRTAADLPGRDVRRPVRRVRRLPDARRRALPGGRHQARPVGQGRGPAATRRLRRHAGRGRRAGRRRSRTGAGQRRGGALPRRRAGPGVPQPARRAAAPARRPLRRGRAGALDGRRRARMLPLPGMHHHGPRDRRPAAGGQHAGQSARPVDQRRDHHHGRAGGTPRPGAGPAEPDGRLADRPGPAAGRAARGRQTALRGRRRRNRWRCCPTPTGATCSSTSRATRCGPPTAAAGAWSTCSGVLDAGDGFHPLGRTTATRNAAR